MYESGEKYEGNLGKFAEGSTNFRGCYVLDIFSISSREIITTIIVNEMSINDNLKSPSLRVRQ